jgi:hypothetical protein
MKRKIEIDCINSEMIKKREYLKYFEDKSYLERISEWFTNVPFFL